MLPIEISALWLAHGKTLTILERFATTSLGGATTVYCYAHDKAVEVVGG
jgi:hypothetical protein